MFSATTCMWFTLVPFNYYFSDLEVLLLFYVIVTNKKITQTVSQCSCICWHINRPVIIINNNMRLLWHQYNTFKNENLKYRTQLNNQYTIFSTRIQVKHPNTAEMSCAVNPPPHPGIQRRRRFAFEVNGEYGSVQGWDDYSSHAVDAGVVITTLWCRKCHSNQAAHNC